MIIINSGIPDSGMEWCRRVFEELWGHFGVPFASESPGSYRETEQLLRDVTAEGNLIVTTEYVTRSMVRLSQRVDVHPFFCVRDPRDIVAERVERQGMRFERVLQRVSDAYKDLSHVCQLPGVMLIPFEHIGTSPEALVFQMATRVGRLVDMNSARTLLARMTAEAAPGGSSAVHLESPTSGARLRHDPPHDLGNRGQSGADWRRELTSGQRAAANARFAPIVATLGFETLRD